MVFIADIALFLGRFHPLVVHLPIGIFFLLAAWEAGALLARFPRLSWMPKLGAGPRGFVLTIAAFGAILAAVLGWLLAEHGSYDPELASRHRILGIAAAGASLVLLLVRRRMRLYAPALVLTLVLLTFAGHYGGVLTHGTGYLTEYMPPRVRPLLGLPPPRAPLPSDPAQVAVFADVIQPLIHQRCASCHGSTRTEGDLRLDTLEFALKGGKHGAALKPGDPAASLLLQRIHLPLDAKEHMPPKEKPQLTDEEVVLLEWWIDAGAPVGRKLVELHPSPEIVELVAARLGLGVPSEPAPDRESTLAAASELAARHGIVIRPLAADAPWIMVSARGQLERFGDTELAELSPIAPALYWLDLGETAVTDAGLTHVGAMTNLRRLHLDRTRITDGGIVQLASLSRLEYLNLYGSGVSDAGLPALRPLTRLRSLHLWETQVTTAAAEALGEEMTDHRRIQRWQRQIAELHDRIRAEQFTVNIGESPRPAADNESDGSLLRSDSAKPDRGDQEHLGAQGTK